MTRVGLMIGSFFPMTQAQEYLIGHAADECRKLRLAVCTSLGQQFQQLTAEDRYLSAMRFAEKMKAKHGLDAWVLHLHRADLPAPETADDDALFAWARIIAEKFVDVTDLYALENRHGFALRALHALERNGLRPELHVVSLPRSRHFALDEECRRNWLECWDDLNEYVQRRLQRRVCLYGAESSGKTTLCYQLTVHYRAIAEMIPEAGRVFMGRSQLNDEDFNVFALQQYSMAFLQAPRKPIKFCDTDLMTTQMFAQIYLKHAVPLVDLLHEREHYDLFLSLAPTVKFVADGTRLLSVQKAREDSYAVLKRMLSECGSPSEEITESDYDSRYDHAVSSVERFLHTCWQ